MGNSTSKIYSEQNAELFLTQQFSGTCNVTCQNAMDNINIDIINTTIGGGIELDQTCATNASCLIGSTTNAQADVLFKANNSTNASDSGYFKSDDADISSIQNIRENINQSTEEDCDISSYNQMNNISIFAANSTIGGDISISQNASTQGQCQLNNNLSASALAAGLQKNTATSGKNKISQKKSAFLRVIIIIAILIALLALSFFASMIIKSVLVSKKKDKTLSANIAAGCPPGQSPVYQDGKPATDLSGKLICKMDSPPSESGYELS